MTDLLHALEQNDALPFHMPGHKRNATLLGGALPYALDITEIEGFDNLHNSKGVLLDIMERARKYWGSDGAYLGVNGSTGSILAGVRAMTRPGDTVLVARNCHIAVWHAVELCGLRPVILEPEWMDGWGIYGAVTQETLDKALEECGEADRPPQACIITSPTYEGITITSGPRCPVPLLIDAAHGAHLPLLEADITVMSLHKTLPALTQTSLLHVRGDRVDRGRLERQLQMFQTSSPSYVLLASIGQCVALLEEHPEWFNAWERRLDAFYAYARQWKNLCLFVQPHDRGKLLLRCDAGFAAAFLRAKKIEPEYARANLLLLMTSPCDTDAMMEQLTLALDELDMVCPPAPAPLRPPSPAPCILPPAACFALPHETVPAAEAVGRVCAEYIWECPPGVPILLPGQRIDRPVEGREWVEVVK